MDEISFGPKHDFRLPPGRWLAATVAIALAAATVALIMTSGGRRVHRPQSPVAAVPVPTRAAAGAPGTLLLTCESANWGRLGKGWRAASLKVGPLWLVGGHQFAHRPSRGAQGSVPVTPRSRRPSGSVMIVEVNDGSTVIMKAAAKAARFFHFVDGFDGPAGNPLPAGDTGFTLRSCPKGDNGPNGSVTDFYLGFYADGASAALVDIQSSVSPRPIRLIFTSPHQRNGGVASSSSPYRRRGGSRELTCGTVHGLHLMPACPTPLPKCSRYRMACPRVEVR